MSEMGLEWPKNGPLVKSKKTRNNLNINFELFDKQKIIITIITVIIVKYYYYYYYYYYYNNNNNNNNNLFVTGSDNLHCNDTWQVTLKMKRNLLTSPCFSLIE